MKAKKFEISSIQFPIWTIARLSQLFTQTVHFPLNSKTLLSTESVLNIRWDEILRISVAQKNINFLGSFHMIWFNPDIRDTCWEDVAETDSFTVKISKPLVPRLSLEWRTEVVCPHVKSPPSELARDVKQPCLGQSPKQLTKVFFSKVYPAYASSKLRGFIRNQADQKGWSHCPPPSQFRSVFRYFIPRG